MTQNSPVDYSALLSADVLDFGTEAVILVSMDPGPPDGFINQIYFEDLLDMFDDISFATDLSSGDLSMISYTPPATPGHPPGLSPFDTVLSFDGDSPAPTTGINNGETGAFRASYSPGVTFGQVEQALIDGKMRMALHLQGIEPNGEESDTYVSLPPNDPNIPEPSTALLFLLSFAILRWTRRR